MSTTIRHPEILTLAHRDGLVTVEGLSAHFGVTLQTIRRDLSDLAESGQLERVHGGAVLPSGTVNIAHAARRDLGADGKAAIARACAARIPPGASIFLNIGTTTEAVARALTSHGQLMVVTNNLNVATILGPCAGTEVVVTGGTLRPADGGLVGGLARDAIAQFHVDTAVIGCSALDVTGSVLDFDMREVGVSRTILTHARRTILVADAGKLSRTAPICITSLRDIDLLITDQPLPPALSERCATWGTEVEVAGDVPPGP